MNYKKNLPTNSFSEIFQNFEPSASVLPDIAGSDHVIHEPEGPWTIIALRPAQNLELKPIAIGLILLRLSIIDLLR